MRLGLLARADQSGLGQQTHAFYTHMRPDRTLVIDMGNAARGDQDFAKYPDGRCALYNSSTYTIEDRAALRWLCAHVDVVYTAEVPYSPDLLAIASETNTRVVVHANPELLAEDMLAAEIWLPTGWHRQMVEDRAGRRVRIMPFPVDERPPVVRDGPPRFVHVGAPAMLDRNGSELVANALPLISEPTAWDIFGAERYGGETHRCGNAEITFHAPVVDHWSLYANADVLVLPRRYGGLSLPMQEAAACGLAIVSLDLEPQRDWLHPVGRVPARVEHWAIMKGGQFLIHDCDPAHLAGAIDYIVREPDALAEMRAHASEWAASLSWSRWTDRYREALERP